MNFNIDIDIAIFFIFLAVNLIAGLWHGRGVRTIEDYSLGGRNFSTGTISATLTATWIGGGFFSFLISKTYSNGIYSIIPILIDYSVTFFIIGFFLSARMGEFLGSVSVAEAMGSLYGKAVRVITAIAGILAISGLIGIQFKISSSLFSHFLNISTNWAMFASSMVVVLYSAFGGIRSITFTDILQFFTFGTVIPIIGLIIWQDVASMDDILTVLAEDKNFHFTNMEFTNPQFLEMIQLSLIFVIPALHPSIFQRISMAKNVRQIKNSFVLSSISAMLMVLVTCWVGILMLVVDPNLKPEGLWFHIIDQYTSPGIRGLIIIGVTAMIMSTADSYINSSSILASHDIYAVFYQKITKKNELLFSKGMSFFIGILSIILAMTTTDMLSLMLLANNFYIPVVTVPLLFTVYGFRSSTKSVLIGMGAGSVTVIIWRIFFMDSTGIDSIVPGTLANVLFLLSTHYLLDQPGGWVGIKDRKVLDELKKERKRAYYNIFHTIKNFNFITFCCKNSPKQEVTYPVCGLFYIISTFSSMYSMPHELQQEYAEVLEIIYHSVLFVASCFLTYPIWPVTFKQEKFISVFWILGTFYILVFSSTLLMMISNFGQLQLMIFMVDLIIMATLLRWYITLFMIISGICISFEVYQYVCTHISIANGTTHMENLQFKVIYFLLLTSSVLLIFLKPKEEKYLLTEEQNLHLTKNVMDIKEELSKMMEIRNEFLRNLQHEAVTPITGITSMGQVLHENYDKFNEQQRRIAVAEISKSSERLNSLITNLVDLSKLSSMGYQLNPEQVNISKLIYERIDKCKKLYVEYKNEDSQEFITDIEDNVSINCDQYYIAKTIDNIIINAIQYCKSGRITIKLKKITNLEIEFAVCDEGIGIPKEELYDVFGTFVVSSRTKTSAGGRGIGLAVCKKVIEAHGGRIWAEQNMNGKGTTIKFILSSVSL
ncbi:Solute carrier and signal transduction histidine kinase domain protein [Candidatus Trichorickettsia mobilis]|uniref:histidine kinase n=1 Tax=Candidatus Trichorickettsia mobilis TaxID=1346319 RepID=A0ABZ0USS8_9RICK|nr:ATP-binding protein [Candidatus Trichorickettsia mobilis]WPY01082.1 Solute carrier and signal transduction histidine kinase domain protein [Candidatus Trichorickettsia mobilis]